MKHILIMILLYTSGFYIGQYYRQETKLTQCKSDLKLWKDSYNEVTQPDWLNWTNEQIKEREDGQLN